MYRELRSQQAYRILDCRNDHGEGRLGLVSQIWMFVLERQIRGQNSSRWSEDEAEMELRRPRVVGSVEMGAMGSNEGFQ